MMESAVIGKGIARSQAGRPRLRMLFLQNRIIGIATFLVLLVIFFSALSGNFATLANLNTVALNAAILVVVASGAAIVVITRNYDLSVGSTVALASYVGLDLVRQFPEAGYIMAIAPVVIGACCGAVNGLLVAYLRVPSVIATLGTMSIYRGLAFLYAGGGQINAQDLPPWVANTASSTVFGVSTFVVVAAAVVAVAAFTLRRLPIGRQMYAVGSNPEAAAYYGLDSRKIVFWAYVLCGLFTGLAAFLFAARSSWIVPYLAQGLELTALAAVVIGGVSVLGGSGSVVGAAIGAVTLAALDNGLVLLGASEFVRQLIQGLAIVVAVVVDAVIQRRVQDLLKTLRWRQA
jgi:rhamnose transport system permease protein